MAAKLQKKDIKVFPGNDITLISSLEGRGKLMHVQNCFTKTQVDGISEAIRDLYIQELELAPPLLQENTILKIPLYGFHQPNSNLRAEIIHTFRAGKTEHITKNIGGSMIDIPYKFELASSQFDGLSINSAKPLDIGTISHEMRHLIYRLAIFPGLIGPLEATNKSMDRIRYPDSNARERNLSKNTSTRTSGLCPPGSTIARPSASYEDTLHLYCCRALDGVSEQSIWEIWERLTEEALRTKKFPVLEDFRRTLFLVLQENANSILMNPAFCEMNTGKQAHLFYDPNNKSGENEFALHSFDIQIQQKNLELAMFEIREIPEPIEISISNKKNTDFFSVSTSATGQNSIIQTKKIIHAVSSELNFQDIDKIEVDFPGSPGLGRINIYDGSSAKQ